VVKKLVQHLLISLAGYEIPYGTIPGTNPSGRSSTTTPLRGLTPVRGTTPVRGREAAGGGGSSSSSSSSSGRVATAIPYNGSAVAAAVATAGAMETDDVDFN